MDVFQKKGAFKERPHMGFLARLLTILPATVCGFLGTGSVLLNGKVLEKCRVVKEAVRGIARAEPNVPTCSPAVWSC